MNGDVLTTLDYAALVRHHRAQGAAATLAMHRRSVKVDYGVVETDGDGRLAKYVEKPEYHYTVSMGVNVLEPRALRHIGDGEALGMPDLLLRLKQAGEKVVAYEEPCLWLDIGRHDDYEEALDVFERRRAEFLGEGA
jgi:NDP-sugar pyrophosphorylase family protein